MKQTSSSKKKSSAKKRSKAYRRRRRKIIVLLRLAGVVIVFAGLVCLIVVLAVRCGGRGTAKTEGEESGETAESAEEELPFSYSPKQYAEAGVNELGDVPVLVYRAVYGSESLAEEREKDEEDADYVTSAELEEALESYYESGYRCVRLSDFAEGVVDTEFGCRPLILTFIADYGQAQTEGWDENGDPVLKEGCALYVLEKIKKEHPDFLVTATFFLDGALFGNGSDEDAKLIAWMARNGYDIGNGTLSGDDLSEAKEEEIKEEVAGMYDLLESIVPGEYINIAALGGDWTDDTYETYGADEMYEPDEEGVADAEDGADGEVAAAAGLGDIYGYICDFTYEGEDYKSGAVLLTDSRSEASVFAADFDAFVVSGLRGREAEEEGSDAAALLESLANGEGYVSDGNPDTVVFPSGERENIGNTYGHKIIEYE